MIRRIGVDFKTVSAFAPRVSSRSMSNGRDRDASSDPPRGVLVRLLETPQLERVVPFLAPETMHQLIRRFGVDECSTLLAAATPDQITAVLDLDLWRNRAPGAAEQFDADRFGEWLDALVDADASAAARIVAGLDVGLATTGLAQYVRVFDPGAIAPSTTTDDGLWGESRPDGLVCALGGYIVQARRTDAWDAIVSLLAALEADHALRFHALMRGCRALSGGDREIDGLHDLLPQAEQLLHDVAAARQQRQSGRGYSTAADARAFLSLARNADGRGGEARAGNPIAAAYFRAARDAPAAAGPDSRISQTPDLRTPDRDIADAAGAVIRELADAGFVPERPRLLLEGTAAPRTLTRIRALMEHARDHDGQTSLARGEELAFLANTLVAGCGLQGRAFTPQEASDAAAAVCNLALEITLRDAPDDYLVDHDLVGIFEAGWSVLYRDVSLHAGRSLTAILRQLSAGATATHADLRALGLRLGALCHAGTPWRARGLLDPIAVLDVPAWTALLGLFSECPVMPEALTAILERRTGAVSAARFDYISTSAQLDAVRAFMARLPRILHD
jgi:hypothetical protein